MMMVDDAWVCEYGRNDWILARLRAAEQPGDADLTCHRWLSESLPKRAVFAALYGDLLESTGCRVLDVGGGFTSLTRELARRHEYHLVDLMAHDAGAADELRRIVGSDRLWIDDWASVEFPERFDVVVANDLFPNVDQRLELFLRDFLPRCAEMRLTLTYYNDGRWYVTKRVDADEILTVAAWNGAMVRRALEAHEGIMENSALDLLDEPVSSPYPNGRQVCLIRLSGQR